LCERRSNLRRRLFFLPLLAAIAGVSPGCGEANPGKFPEPKHAGATRDGVTPVIPLDSAKQQKLSPKQKAALKATENIDPRGR
jgi:hypothetical protein